MNETQTQAELEIEESELSLLRTKLANEKFAIQSELADINAKCSTRIDNQLFRKYQTQRAAILRQLQDKERELGDVKAQTRLINTRKEVAKAETKAFAPDEMRMLIEIRDKWNGISLDDHWHNERRKAAWEFVKELNTILKPKFAKQD